MTRRFFYVTLRNLESGTSFLATGNQELHGGADLTISLDPFSVKLDVLPLTKKEIRSAHKNLLQLAKELER